MFTRTPAGTIACVMPDMAVVVLKIALRPIAVPADTNGADMTNEEAEDANDILCPGGCGNFWFNCICDMEEKDG